MRYWYVVIDDTPVNPERPLSARDAAQEFLTFIEDDDPDQEVELRQCSAEDLEWAGVDAEETG